VKFNPNTGIRKRNTDNIEHLLLFKPYNKMMDITVKTLKGEKFTVQVEPTHTIAEVKTIIEAAKAELPAMNMKLIHSGTVLKDTDTIEACDIKPNAFLVVMITKAKKVAATPSASTEASTTVAATPAVASTSSTPAAPTKSEATASTTETPAPISTSVPSPTAAGTTTTTTTETEANSSNPDDNNDTFPQESVTNLMAMGFPEAEVRACLRASQGNPDVAVEFLMNGIPPEIQAILQQEQQQQRQGSTTAGGVASQPSSSTANNNSAGQPLQVLRDHPQINQLRRLVQSNPSTLQVVLTQIGQQQPHLLEEINNNQELFLQIMNEPIPDEDTTTTSTSRSGSSGTSSSRPSSSSNPMSAGGGGGLGMLQNPAQMAQMLQNMNPQELSSMAAMMGLTPEQLSATTQMISRMPPEMFEQYLNMANASDPVGLGGFMGGRDPVMGGGGAGNEQVVRLTEEEMEAVNRLADMGFDRTAAVQAYLACDKNEALAANLLMDGGFVDDMDMMGDGNEGDDDGDDMYD
jgi:UV excision repair protein RAD23